MSTIYDSIMVDPTPAQFTQSLRDAKQKCNARHRVRTVVIDCYKNYSVENYMRGYTNASYAYGGVGVGERIHGHPTTSCLDIVWFTDPVGRRHVRICSGRVLAIKSWGATRTRRMLDAQDWKSLMVYWELRIPTVATFPNWEYKDATIAGLHREIRDNPLDLAHRNALADYYTDLGHESTYDARRAREAAECLQRLYDPISVWEPIVR